MATERQEQRQAERATEQAEEERIKQEKTDAYIKLEDQIADLDAQNQALYDQFPTGSIPAETQRILDQNIEQIRILTSESEAIYNSTFGKVHTWARKERTKDLVTETNAEGSDAPRDAKERRSELKNETLSLAAQNLIDAGLLPADLKGGERMAQAARIIGREGASPEELSALADQIKPYYEVEFTLNEAAEDMEKGVVVGRTTDAIKEVVKNPAKLGGAALGLLGAWLLYSAVGHGPDDGTKKWIKGILGVAGLGIGIGVATGALSTKNIGLGDALEKVTGLRGDQAFSTPEMDKVRHFFDGMPTGDTDAVDDFIRVVDAPIENVADMFDEALRNGDTKVDSARLLGNGLSSKEHSFIDDGSLYTANKWFFMEAYKMGLADGSIQASTDEKSQLSSAVQWCRTKFKGHKMGSCLAAMELVRLGTQQESAPLTVESSIKEPHLAALADRSPAFERVLRPTTRPNVFLLNGYPVRYNFTDTKDHVFEDVMDPTKNFVLVDAALKGDSLENTLARLSKDARERAQTGLETEYPAYAGRLTYKVESEGYWELDPKEARIAHAGLPNFMNDKTVEMVFYFDVEQKVTRLGLDANQDGKIDPFLGNRNTPYTTVAEVKEDFEKPLLHSRITADINKTLLVPFTVTGFADAGTETKIQIQYGTAKGEVIYENDKIKSYTLGADADLESKWTAAANEKRVQFLGDPRVQQALLRATTSYTGYNPSLMAGLVDKFVGLTKDGLDWLKSDGIANTFDSEWEKQVVRNMTKLIYDPVTGFSKLYVDNVFRTRKANDSFQATEDAFMNTRIADLEGSGVVMAPVVPEKAPDMAIEWADLTREINEKGQSRIENALAPLRNEKPTPSSSFSWTVVNGAYNFVMGDAGRNEYSDRKVSDYMQKLAANVIARGTPSTTTTPPTDDKVTRYELEEEIVKMEREAMTEAVRYWGTTDEAATEKMMVAPNVIGTGWEKSTRMVASYLSKNLKWEQYGILPNPENMAAIMSVWYEKMGNPSVAPKTPEQADQYAKYFIWEVWVCFGGNKDYSLDRLYSGKIESVSDSQFDAEVTGFESRLKDYATWSTASALEIRPPVPGMEDSLELYKTSVKKQMEEWFAQQNDIQVWSRVYRWGPMMFRWPEVYKESFDRRLADILVRSSDINVLQKDLKDYKNFVIAEQYMVYEPLIMAGITPETDQIGVTIPWSVYVEEYITKDYKLKYFDATPRDLNGYIAYIKKNMADVFDTTYNPPDIWGIPFIP